MKKQMKIMLVFLLAFNMLCGCKKDEIKDSPKDIISDQEATISNDDIVIDDGSLSEDSSVIENADIQDNNPAIVVEETGYDVSDKKLVFFTKKPYASVKDESIFRVISVDQRAVVYEGKILSQKRGDFSSVKEPGYYYIEVPHLGRSRAFYIGEGLLRQNERKIYSLFTNLLKQKVELASDDLVLEDKEFINEIESIQWLLRYDELGKEHSDDILNVSITDDETLAMSLVDTLENTVAYYQTKKEEHIKSLCLYATCLAQISDAIVECDNELAYAYLNQSKLIYNDINEYETKDEYKSYFYYLNAYLYKCTGEQIYCDAFESEIKSLLNSKLYNRGDSEASLQSGECFIYGSVAYLNTTYDVDINCCETLMTFFSNQVQKYVSDSKKTPCGSISVDERNRLLTDRLFLVSVMERVIISQEYLDVIQQGFQYVNGCNELQQNFVTDQGIYNEAVDEDGYQLSMTGAYLYFLYELNHAEFEKGN